MTTPRDEMNHLLRTAADLALEQIEEHGEFVPFAVVLAQGDELRLIALGDDELQDDGEKDLTKIRDILLGISKNEEFVATAIISDVRVRMEESGEVTDAVRVEIEHAEDQPITVILPYRLENSVVEQHIEPYTEPGERIVFV